MIVNQLRETETRDRPTGAVAAALPEPAGRVLAWLVRWHWRLEPVLIPAALLLLAPLLVYASNGLTPLLAVLALFYLPRVTESLPGLTRLRQRHWWLPMGFLVFWAAASAFWSLQPQDDLISGLQLGVTMAIGVLVVRGLCLTPPPVARRMGLFLPLSVLLVALLASAEILLDFPYPRRMLAQPPDYEGPDFLFLNNIARGMPVMLFLAWPAAYLLWFQQRRRLLAVLLLALVAAVLLYLPMGATKMALVLSAAAGGLALLWPRIAIALTCSGAVLVGLAMAALLFLAPPGEVATAAAGRLPDSWTHRLQIWRYTADHIAERPLEGFGFDASRRIGGQLVSPTRQVPLVTGNGGQRLPLHPHSMPLQVWLELGVIGLFAVAFLMFGVLRLIWRMAWDPPGAAMALATLVSWTAIASLSFGIWQTWWLNAAWLAVAAVVLARRTVADRPAGA